jgi:hypothetical protein
VVDVDIYLDVDGVLFTAENNRFQLRDGFIDFLDFITKNFINCYWLTCWNDGFNDVLQQVYAQDIARKFKTAEWIDNKALAIDYSRSFIWIEDGICPEEMQILKQKNCVNNYIAINPYGEMDRLRTLKTELIQRFNIKQ